MSSGYINHVLADSPWIYYPCDDRDSTIRDLGPSRYHGTWNGSAQSYSPLGGVKGSGGSRLLTGATGSYGRSPQTASWGPTQFTWEFWINPTTTFNYNQQMCMSTSSTGTVWGNWLNHTGANGEIWTGTHAVAGSGRFEGLANYYSPANTWLYYTYTFNAGTATLYKNGVQFATGTHSNPDGGAQYLFLGPTDTNFAQGYLQHVAGFLTALSPARIAARYQESFRGAVSY